MRVVAVIPAWNEEATVAAVIRGVLPFAEPLVVDDGSTDATAKEAVGAGARVIRHAVNRGLGAAISTGFAAAKLLGADAVITLDADGQHAAENIPALLAPLVKGDADVVLGTRSFAKGHMPFRRRLANRLGNLVTFFLFGVHVTDSQSGFRAFSAKALREMHLRTDRMEVSSEIVAEIRERNLRLVEVPIHTIYTAYSLSKGQSLRVGITTLLKLVFHRISR